MRRGDCFGNFYTIAYTHNEMQVILNATGNPEDPFVFKRAKGEAKRAACREAKNRWFQLQLRV